MREHQMAAQLLRKPCQVGITPRLLSAAFQSSEAHRRDRLEDARLLNLVFPLALAQHRDFPRQRILGLLLRLLRRRRDDRPIHRYVRWRRGAWWCRRSRPQHRGAGLWLCVGRSGDGGGGYGRRGVGVDGDFGEDGVVPSDPEAVGLESAREGGSLAVQEDEEGRGRTFMGRLDGKRSLDSKAWLVMLCRGRVTRWETWIGSAPLYTIWCELSLQKAVNSRSGTLQVRLRKGLGGNYGDGSRVRRKAGAASEERSKWSNGLLDAFLKQVVYGEEKSWKMWTSKISGISVHDEQGEARLRAAMRSS